MHPCRDVSATPWFPRQDAGTPTIINTQHQRNIGARVLKICPHTHTPPPLRRQHEVLISPLTTSFFSSSPLLLLLPLHLLFWTPVAFFFFLAVRCISVVPHRAQCFSVTAIRAVLRTFPTGVSLEDDTMALSANGRGNGANATVAQR